MKAALLAMAIGFGLYACGHGTNEGATPGGAAGMGGATGGSASTGGAADHAGASGAGEAGVSSSAGSGGDGGKATGGAGEAGGAGVNPTIDAADFVRVSQRAGAFRSLQPLMMPPEPSEWQALLGQTASVDRCYSSFAPAPASFETTQHPFYALSFLSAARFVNTMITNARWDGTVLGEAIVPALNAIVDLEVEPLFFRGARYLGDAPNVPSEQIVLDYGDAEGRWVAGQRDVYFPTFEHSGHEVTASEPLRFYEATAAFLSRTGL